ncbi:unnamed protein product [Nippostrongylus brasiliensis]|uniref:Bestrophin homolog n=1 Tax=Nippostrongylus brasiliensis TaxID=27835 RepID=A0A0N4XYE2_NIPBR|nr:unnamed protein product [Nippostrongylus brasiliensis]
MTVSYSGNFVRLLLRWKGSIWRSVWIELVVFLVLFYTVRLFSAYGIPAIDDEHSSYRKKFQMLCRAFNEYTRLIPLTFVLGFYVSNVVSRWWRQFECLSWPEDLLAIICLIFHENTEDARKKRHQIARYLNLVAALAWRDVSDKIRLRFPDVRNLVEAGRASTYYLSVFVNEMKQYRTSFRKLFCHDWVCVPLVYTQVASLATYSFFVFCLFGRQHIDEENEIDTVFPLFTVVQFLFYVGWYKVGQDLMRPFGLDDDDIELSYILDRNIVISFATVDCLQADSPPEFEEDAYWRHLEDTSLYSNPSSLKFGRVDLSRTAHKHPPKLHSCVEVRKEEQRFLFEKFRDDASRPQRYISW